MSDLAESTVDSLNAMYGAHPGSRAVHARGFFCRGRFTATPRAAELTRAAHMSGEPVDVLARFSIAVGDPTAPDWTAQARGLAVKFSLPDGTHTDLVTATARTFYVRTPEDFAQLMGALSAGVTSPLRLAVFVVRHPESFKALREVTLLKPIPSYARARYNSLHAYRWSDASDHARWLRYSWTPEAGEASVGRLRARRMGRDYLRAELEQRLAAGPVVFALEVQFAADGDPLDDCTAAWPGDRESAVVGRLEVVEIAHDPEAREPVVFDPMRLTDGIEPSNDPILHFRPKAYAVSVSRRTDTTNARR